MNGRMPQAWIFGAFVMAALVGFHWFAYRVAQRRAARRHRGGERRAVAGGNVISNEPLIPK